MSLAEASLAGSGHGADGETIYGTVEGGLSPASGRVRKQLSSSNLAAAESSLGGGPGGAGSVAGTASRRHQL